MLLMISTAPHCMYMSLPLEKAFNHHGWVTDKGKVWYEVFGKSVEEVKVVETMPRFFGINKRVYFGQGLTVSQVLEVLTAKAAGRELEKLTK